MRQKRVKMYRKLMSLYSMHFGFRQPYQVIFDSEFCKDVHALHTDVSKQLGTVLQGSVKPMITQCCIHELYLQGPAQQPVVDLAKTFERRKCNHREAIAGDECIASVVGETNKHRYVIAAQSQPLRANLRAIAGVPLVHINRSVVILEPPSHATLAAKEAREEEGQKATAPERAQIQAVDAQQTAQEPPRKTRRGPKGPNPLSVKKKQPKVEQGRVHADGKGKRRAVSGAAEDADGKMKVTAGVKRKGNRDDGEGVHAATRAVEMEERKGDVVVDSAEKQGGGHKRKRRRKAAAQAQNMGHAEADDGSE